MIQVNSIVIPRRFVAICSEWYSGVDCMLYAVASTGGLTTGTTCTISVFKDSEDRERRWYLDLWCKLSCDISYARSAAIESLKSANDRYFNLEDCTDSEVKERFDDWAGASASYDVLSEFEGWVDNSVIPRLSESYGL